MPKPQSQHGFALIIVLWAVVLAALVATQVTALGRRETQIASNLGSEAAAEAAADGAVYDAIYRLMRNEPGWLRIGEPHRVTIGSFIVNVTVSDEAGKIDLNNSPLPLLAALNVAVGIEPSIAQNLAMAIGSWRGDVRADPAQMVAWRDRYRAAGYEYAPPNEAFETVEELSLVLGMTPEYFNRLEPHISVYGGTVDPNFADPVVLAALQSMPGAPAATAAAATSSQNATGAAHVVAINARAASDDTAFVRHAIVNVGGRNGRYAIYRWNRGSG